MTPVRHYLHHPAVPLSSLERLARALGVLPERGTCGEDEWRRRVVLAIDRRLRAEEPARVRGMYG